MFQVTRSVSEGERTNAFRFRGQVKHSPSLTLRVTYVFEIASSKFNNMLVIAVHAASSSTD